jgi:FKBP-type peptidyl-prolyl cis-trans isomerase
MDKSKLIAIVALVLGIGLIGLYKEKPLPADEDDHDHDSPAAQSAPPPHASKSRATAPGGSTPLQTKDVRVGTGTLAKSGDSVTVNYRGTLLDGKVFDQSYGKEPFQFNLGAGRVIKGWDQGVAGMKVGGKRQLTIPPELAYGPGGQGAIPPNSTLKFDVELLQVNGKK